MSDTVNIAGRAGSLEKADKLMPFTKVRIYLDNNSSNERTDEEGRKISYFEAGNDNGRMLEVDNPFGTQQMAEDMLEKLTGKQYQPFEAESAQVDPAAEIGDGITISDVYSGLYKSKLTFSSLMTSDIAAPFEEEIDREYKYQSATERKFAHQIDDVRASLIITQQNIEANVLRKQGPDETSFGWNLTDEFHEWYANGDRENPVMKITASGLYVKGQIEASSGHIGGFKINATQISNWSSGTGVWISTKPYTERPDGTPIPQSDDNYNDVFQVGDRFHVKNDGSVYISNWANDGTGIWLSTKPSSTNRVFQIGNNFYVKNDGSIYANNGTFKGTIEATSGKFSGTIEASTISGNLIINGSTYSPAAVGGGIGGGSAYNKAIDPNGAAAPYFRANRLGCTTFYQGGYTWGAQTLNYKDHNGNDRTLIVFAGQR